MSNTDYTFQLSPGGKARHNAGSYSQETCLPKYELEISIPEHAKNQVDIQQFLMGNEGSRTWVWEITNNSTWPAFCSVTKDGELVKNS